MVKKPIASKRNVAMSLLLIPKWELEGVMTHVVVPFSRASHTWRASLFQVGDRETNQ
jgi:hypothetical protein